MIAYDKHQCTNHFLCIAEINCNNNCISLIIPMFHYVRNYFEQTLHGSNCNRLQTFYCIMISDDKHQCTNHFLYNHFHYNCISQMIPMLHYVWNHFKHTISIFLTIYSYWFVLFVNFYIIRQRKWFVHWYLSLVVI